MSAAALNASRHGSGTPAEGPPEAWMAWVDYLLVAWLVLIVIVLAQRWLEKRKDRMNHNNTHGVALVDGQTKPLSDADDPQIRDSLEDAYKDAIVKGTGWHRG